MRIFVPSIMGAGIVVSVAILLGDLGRSLAPNAAKARRRAVVRRRALALVAPIATAIGAPPPAVPVARRRLRRRGFYAVLFAVSTGLSVYVALGSTFNFRRRGGYLEGVIWVEALALSFSAVCLAVGVVALTVALRYPLVPKWVRPLIDRTPLGVRQP
ncbi:MAG: hypothetical protein ACT4PI_09895 [Actinomycetota bacterium]